MKKFKLFGIGAFLVSSMSFSVNTSDLKASVSEKFTPSFLAKVDEIISILKCENYCGKYKINKFNKLWNSLDDEEKQKLCECIIYEFDEFINILD